MATEPSLLEKGSRKIGATDASAHRGQAMRRALRVLNLDRYSGIYALAVIIVIFGLWVPQTFLTVTTLQSVLSEQSITAVVTLGLLAPLAAGVFDLSIGGVLGFAVVLVVLLQANYGFNPIVASVATVLTSALFGAVNAFVVVKLRVNSFIATLGMGSVLGAMVIWVTGNQQITTGIADSFANLAGTQPLGIPVTFVYLIAFAIAIWYALEHTPWGRFLYAVGGNQQASRLAGIRVERYIAVALVASATVAGIAGIFYASLVQSAPLTAGPPFLLPAFAAAFLGATQIRPGRFNVAGALVAVFLLATGVKGLQLIGSDPWVGQLFDGLALVAAVALAHFRTRRSRPIT